MKNHTKLSLFRWIFVAGTVLAVVLMACELYLCAVGAFVIGAVLDFVLRRCPKCGKHFSIQQKVHECCPYCGQQID